MNDWLAGLVAVLVMLASSLAGWPLTAGVLRLAARSADSGGPDDARGSAAERGSAPADLPAGGAGADDGPTGPRARAALRGGTWIGILERLAVTGSVLLGYPAAVAFVIAVKGLGRYPELREHPGASERFVIGTLASLLWAAALGALGAALLA